MKNNLNNNAIPDPIKTDFIARSFPDDFFGFSIFKSNSDIFSSASEYSFNRKGVSTLKFRGCKSSTAFNCG